MEKYKEIAPFVEENYWDMTISEATERLGCGTSTYQNAVDYLNLPRKTKEKELECRYGVPADWLLDTLHNTLRMSVNQMSDELPVSRYWIQSKMGEWGINRRSQSAAEELKWSQMSDEQRTEQVSAAHEATTNNHCGYKLSTRGYPVWQTKLDGKHQVLKVHRLLAIAEFGFDAVCDSIVHHGAQDGGPNELPPVEIPWANWGENLRLFDTNSEHRKHHARN
jgi:hypothetical protein